jgi:uncharacterized peroxidase-related enzyme
MPLLRSLPANASLVDLRRRYGDLLEKLRPYGHRLMRGRSPLTTAQRELIASYVSGLNSCRYCYGVHSRVAEQFGVDDQLLGGLLEDIDHAPVDARLRPILRYVRKLTETPSRMTEADAAAVYAAGWDDEALLHAVAVCAYFNNMNRLVEGCGIVGNADVYATGAQQLTAHGYRTPQTRNSKNKPGSRQPRGRSSRKRPTRT